MSIAFGQRCRAENQRVHRRPFPAFENSLPDVASRLVRHSLGSYGGGRSRKSQTTGRSRDYEDEFEND
jgi:hypothetical protein